MNSMNNEIDWLCTLGVTRGIYTIEQVIALYEICPPETEMMEFAQSTLDNGFTDNVTILQEILEEAIQNAAQYGPCPHSILTNNQLDSEDDSYEIEDDPYELDITEEDIEEISPLSAAPSEPDSPRRKIPFPAANRQEAPPVISTGPPPLGAAPSPTPVKAAPAPAAPSGGGDFKYVSNSANYPFDVNKFPNLSDVETDPSAAERLIKQFLEVARSVDASDVHISADSYPHIRRYAVNYLIDAQPRLSVEAAFALNSALLTSEQLDVFKETFELDYSAGFEGKRYRVNIMKHYRGIEGSYRIITDRIKTLKELGFRNPEVIEKLTTYHQGLILVTGPAGCGKTTTLSSLVELINKSREDHIITVEDPVEILVPSKGCNVTQRELNQSTKSFANALRAALREDPDIIVIGEMRDLETIEMAISAAETGHLVIGTLHTSSAGATLDRLLDVFPPSQQPQIRAMLAEGLKGIICQRLVPNIDGTKLLMAPEILIGTLAVGNLIKEGKTFQLPSIIETGSKKGMTSSENSILELYQEGQVTYAQTKPYVKTVAKLKVLELMNQAGGAKAYAKQQELAAAAREQDPKKKGWFK
jgi:twitching motility protein PilT